MVKNRHIAEILLHWREHTLTAKDTNADMYQALTRCIDKIEKQALKLKKKIIERKQDATPLSAVAPQPDTGRRPRRRTRSRSAARGASSRRAATR